MSGRSETKTTIDLPLYKKDCHHKGMLKHICPLVFASILSFSCASTGTIEAIGVSTERSAEVDDLIEDTSRLESEKIAVPDIEERFRLREAARKERLKSLTKIHCNFETLGNWQNFLEFQSLDQPKIIKGEVIEWGIRDVSLQKIGKITKGPCKGGQIYLATYTDEYPNKTGPGPNYLLADGFLTSELPYDRSDADYSDETKAVVVKIGNHFITAGKDEKFLNFLMDFGGNFYAYNDPKIEYRNLFIPADGLTINGKKINLVAGTFYWLRTESILHNDAAKIFEDPAVGELYNFGKASEMKWPDGLWSTVNIGVEQRKPEYWFDSFLEEPKFEAFRSAELVPSPGVPDWLELAPANASALKEPYDAYLNRIDSLAEMIQEFKDANVPFSLETLTFDEYQKRKPFLFIKDSLGRTQVHRRSLHEVPLLAEPLIYIYGQSGLEVNVKLCSHLVHRLSWPAYGNGWKVRLLGDGMLWDLNNSKKVGTLFWEGFAGPIPPLKYGWVLKPSEIPSFLERTLPQYGLNKKETADFKRYWAAVLTQAPFYRVEMIPSEWIDKICPLSISPEPEKLLRVYLRAYPKEEFEDVPAPPLPPLQAPRPDFTVVEWGGVLE